MFVLTVILVDKLYSMSQSEVRLKGTQGVEMIQFPLTISDVDECEDNNGDCEHRCVNEDGGYRCTCREGFRLRGDNRTCETDGETTDPEAQPAHRDRCYANCETVQRLHDKLRGLQEKVGGDGRGMFGRGGVGASKLASESDHR